MPFPALVDHCCELLAPLGPVRVRRMFGGFGFYVDGLFLAIIAWERLYLKVDADSRERFVAAGCEPFVYDAKGQGVTLGYYSAPAEAMDSPALMAPWARLALQAALSARAAKAAPRPATAKAAPRLRRAAAKTAARTAGATAAPRKKRRAPP
jgi:DNA transformation protein and related proteins